MEIGLLITNLTDLEQVADAGYDYVETVPWILDPDYLGGVDVGEEAAGKVLQRLHSSPIPVASLCGFLPDPEVHGLMVVGPQADLDRLRAYVTRLFGAMQRAGIGVIGYGSGSSRWVPAGFDPERAMQQVRDFLGMCDEIGARYDVQVALEPYNRDDANLLNTVAEALRLVQDLDLPNCRLMADFFHMKLNGESFRILADAGPALIHAHIAEPGRGRTQTSPDEHAHFLHSLRQAGYDGRVTQTGPLPAYASPGQAAAALKKAAGR